MPIDWSKLELKEKADYNFPFYDTDQEGRTFIAVSKEMCFQVSSYPSEKEFSCEELNEILDLFKKQN